MGRIAASLVWPAPSQGIDPTRGRGGEAPHDWMLDGRSAAESEHFATPVKQHRRGEHRSPHGGPWYRPVGRRAALSGGRRSRVRDRHSACRGAALLARSLR